MPRTPDAPVDRLLFPRDLEAWARWEASHHRLRRAKAAVVETLRTAAGRRRPSTEVISTYGSTPRILVVVDAPTASQRSALLAPVEHLLAQGRDVAVLCPREVVELLPGDAARWQTVPLTARAVAERLEGVDTVLAVGHYLSLGAGAYRWAVRHGARFCVVQHGLLTPFMAPLPPGAHLLAWSEEDAAFWASGRHDVTHEVVGGQLLWRAAQEPAPAVPSDARPTFVGQLHGVELGRAYMTRVSHDFCVGTGALYRPHPSERDKLSRLTHAAWEREGIEIDRGGTPLFQTGQPVVSVFSTGVLEAAARGIPAWVCTAENLDIRRQKTHILKSPSWLFAFHDRYSMGKWGQDATSQTCVPTTEPAAALTRCLTSS